MVINCKLKKEGRPARQIFKNLAILPGKAYFHCVSFPKFLKGVNSFMNLDLKNQTIFSIALSTSAVGGNLETI